MRRLERECMARGGEYRSTSLGTAFVEECSLEKLDEDVIKALVEDAIDASMRSPSQDFFAIAYTVNENIAIVFEVEALYNSFDRRCSLIVRCRRWRSVPCVEHPKVFRDGDECIYVDVLSKVLPIDTPPKQVMETLTELSKMLVKRVRRAVKKLRKTVK